MTPRFRFPLNPGMAASTFPWFYPPESALPREREHAPTMLPGDVLLDYLPAEGLYRTWLCPLFILM